MSSYITTLVKITNFPDDLLKGELYCNTWEYFDMLDRKGIGDNTEMTQAILNTEIENKFLNKRYSFRLVNNDIRYAPVYCLYSHYSQKYKQPSIIKLSEKVIQNLGLYKYAVFITDVKEFLNLINIRMPSFCYSPIKYIDYGKQKGKTIYEPITKKDKSKYGYQQEFRIYNYSIAITRRDDFNLPGIKKIPGIENNKNLAEKFFVGNLTNIAKVFPVEMLPGGISISLNIDWDYCHKNKLVKNINSKCKD